MIFSLSLVFCLSTFHLANGRSIEQEEEAFVEQHPNKYPNIPYRGDLFQGDIKLRPTDLGEPQKPNQLNAVWNKGLLWPGNVIYYYIRQNEFSASEVSAIYTGINRLQNSLAIGAGGNPCIYFIEDPSQPFYVDIRRLDGCWSYVGRIGGSQEMSLGTGCFSPGTVQHEFLHALGFYHEQSREDRDSFVTIVWDNIYQDYWYAFDKYQQGVTIDHLGFPYDYNSVMHYHAYAFAIDPTRPTIIPHDPGADISHKDWISAIDTQMTQVLYGCMKAADSTYFKHLVNVDF